MSERDLKVDRLERSLSSLQENLKVTTTENTTLKDRLRKVGFLHEESGRLTAELNQRTKELEDVVSERDQLKNSLEMTQAQVKESSNLYKPNVTMQNCTNSMIGEREQANTITLSKVVKYTTTMAYMYVKFLQVHVHVKPQFLHLLQTT